MNAPTPTDKSLQTAVLAALSVYLRPGVLIVLLLGFSSGLPLALSGETLRVWMADRGVDLGTIGLLTLAGLPYTLKFLWAPIVDAWDVPYLSRRLGRRRGWLVGSQLLLMGTIVFLGTRNPLSAPLMVGLAALLVAFASATQDIVIDAFRVQSLPADQQAAGMASYVAAYRVGMLASGAGVIGLSAWLETQGVSKEAIWPIAYAGAALLVLVGLVAALLAREPASAEADAAAAVRAEPIKRFFDTAKGAFVEFFKRDAALAILVFVVLFKLCDALAGAMTAPFVLSLGYTKAEYAAIVKGVGLAALLAGGFAGGAVARALPLHTSLWIAAIVQMLSNLVFVWLGTQATNLWSLTVAIVVENFSGAIGTVIFVAYLSALCRNPLHTATQYALLTAFASTGRTLFSSGTGFAAQMLGWPAFFITTALAALPALALMTWLGKRDHFRALEAERNSA
ncbi:MFS transporter [Hyphomicrobium sp.]|uniref:AmpG family muropeptide MFS transporter n=1 Tax=Hyphomicrobium sp. TaxID=82 RepID=UPI0025C19284|nr:MFS transporter [Hyphomicrobium sp.]MCC7251934.1 MFS transporter [Hyphomicrobium sp.]